MTARPRILDLFSGAGGAAAGYHRAGFDVVGVDIRAQPRYPFEFVQADALAYVAEHGHEFDAIHASPPCQAYSTTRHLTRATNRERESYDDLVEPTRRLLTTAGRPYIIENVVGAPLIDPVQLCGSSFGLPLRRHRLFESSIVLLVPPCAHKQLPKVWPTSLGSPAFRRVGQLTRYVGVYGSTHGRGEHARWKAAMGIDWMARRELTQAIPPVYTELLGGQLIRALAP